MHSLLLVDDEVNVLHALRRILSKVKKWQLVTVSNPLEALEIASNSHFDLFLSDYRMPEMDGVEFLMHTKRYHPDAMRLILSGDTDFSGLVDAINKAEIYRFISKPVQSYDLVSTIEQALQLYEVVNENKLLAEQVRKQKRELRKRDLALKKFAQEHPVLAQVDWDEDGAIILNEDEIQDQ
jgi:two-component system, probable response regulator PhcQ